MVKKSLSKTNKNKVKIKQLSLPILSSCFFIALIIFGTISNDLSNLMGNSVINNYFCSEGYTLDNNMCVAIIKATKLGDVNDDSQIDVNDLELIAQHINEEIVLTSQNFKAADLNQDGQVSVEDENILKSYLNGEINISGLVCPDAYSLKDDNCYIVKQAFKLNNTNTYNTGDVIKYNDSYWFVLSDNDDYVTALKSEPLSSDELGKYAINNNGTYDNIMYYNSNCQSGNCNSYDISDVKIVLDAYSISMADALKEVNGYKIRLITIEELVELGFTDKTNTLYYEIDNPNLYWIGSNDREYWVMNSITNNTNNTFMVVDYNNNSYVYENVVNRNLGLVRPVINLKKSAIK